MVVPVEIDKIEAASKAVGRMRGEDAPDEIDDGAESHLAKG